jgi:hypothetical protein
MTGEQTSSATDWREFRHALWRALVPMLWCAVLGGLATFFWGVTALLVLCVVTVVLGFIQQVTREDDE